MTQIIKNKKSVLEYFFLPLSVFFLGHLVYTFFDKDVALELASIFVDVIFSSLFLLASFKFDYAFFSSLLLVPVFFLVENISILEQIYNSESLKSVSVYNVDPRVIGFSTAILFSLIFIFRNKTKVFFKTPLSEVLILAIIYFCFSAFWSVGGQEKYVQVTFYILLATLYFTTFFSVKGKKSFYRLIIFFIVLSLPIILMAYFQAFGGFFFEYADMDIRRVSGPFNSPNLLGSFLLITFALAIMLLLVLKKEKRGKFNLPLVSYLILSLPIFFLTFSRSAWVGLVVFAAIFSLQSKRFFVGVTLIFILLLSTMLMFESTRERISGFSERTMFDSVYARTNIWRMSHKKFLERPLLGYGAGSFSEVINDAKESAGGTDNPHNDIVFFSVEGGIVGVVSFLSIMLSFYFYLFKFHFKIRNKKNKDYSLSILSLGVLSLFIAMTVVSTVESYYEGNFLHLFLWSLLGGWFALARKEITLE